MHFQIILQPLFRIPQRPREAQLRQIVREQRGDRIKVRRGDGLHGLRDFQGVRNAGFEFFPREPKRFFRDVLIVFRKIQLTRRGIQVQKRIADVALDAPRISSASARR